MHKRFLNLPGAGPFSGFKLIVSSAPFKAFNFQGGVSAFAPFFTGVITGSCFIITPLPVFIQVDAYSDAFNIINSLICAACFCTVFVF